MSAARRAALILTVALAAGCGGEEPAVYQVPDTRAEIVVERRPVHVARAEPRRLVLRVAGRTVAHAEMAKVPRGASPTALRHVSGARYRVVDYRDSYTVDVNEHVITRDSARSEAGRLLGTFVMSADAWTFSAGGG